MINIIYITYHIDNLRFSLPALHHLNYEFNLIIHNDNPSLKLTQEWILENCGKINYKELIIINEDVNKGMLFSRITAFRAAPKSDYTLFMDDDDYLLIRNLPEFDNKHVYYRYNNYYAYNKTDLENALKNQGILGDFANICASFWKSDFISEVFEVFENHRLPFVINSNEDYLILQISQALALKNKVYYLKQIDEVGQIYVQLKDIHKKYEHIQDPRYIDLKKAPIENYDAIIEKYSANLRVLLIEHKI